MSTVLIFFALPIGILFFLYDRKNIADADRLFERFIADVQADSRLDIQAKTDQIDEMFYQNGFKRVQKSPGHLIVEKKHLNLGIPVILFALLSYIGIGLFVLYYFYFLKPIRKEIRFDAEQE